MSGDFNSAMLERVDAYADAMERRFEFYLETVFFPTVNGKRQTLFTDSLSEQEEFIRLQDAARMAALVAQGQAEPTPETQMFTDNVDGAQERYAELGAKYQGASR